MASEEFSLHIQQEQKLQQKLTPQQVMFGRMLEMSAPEIDDDVRRELDDNPALEILTHEDADRNYDSEDSFHETAEELQHADYSSSEEIPFFNDSPRVGLKRFEPGFDYLSIAEAEGDEEGSLHSVMVQRARELELNESDKIIAEHIIGNLDNNGYLNRTLASITSDISSAEGKMVKVEDVRRVFTKIRTLDPPGIGAVDLRDCLLLQLDRLPDSLEKKVAQEVIADNFDIFSKKHFNRLRSSLGVSDATLQNALNLIKTLNPKPGALIGGSSSSDRANHILPDFAVEIDSDSNRFSVSLLNQPPELTVDSSFTLGVNTLKEEKNRRQKEALAFIKKKYDEAFSFINLLKERSNTLLSVMRAIVARQHQFFISGNKSDLAPMILKDIANDTGFDISTVSRAASGKYVLTPHGIFPLKTLFNERPKIHTDITSHTLLENLQEIIENEDKSHPYSDEALKDILVKRGFDIARRTVAKYRERLGLPVGRLRKNF